MAPPTTSRVAIVRGSVQKPRHLCDWRRRGLGPLLAAVADVVLARIEEASLRRGRRRGLPLPVLGLGVRRLVFGLGLGRCAPSALAREPQPEGDLVAVFLVQSFDALSQLDDRLLPVRMLRELAGEDVDERPPGHIREKEETSAHGVDSPSPCIRRRVARPLPSAAVPSPRPSARWCMAASLPAPSSPYGPAGPPLGRTVARPSSWTASHSDWFHSLFDLVCLFVFVFLTAQDMKGGSKGSARKAPASQTRYH